MLKQSQKERLLMTQKMSPYQILLMKLLQIPSVMLEQRINEELESNPALVEVDDNSDFSDDNNVDTFNKDENVNNENLSENNNFENDSIRRKSSRYVYDYQSNTLYGNREEAHLIEAFISPYYSWIGNDGKFDSENNGNYTYVYTEFPLSHDGY